MDCIDQILTYYCRSNDIDSEEKQQSQIVKLWSFDAVTRLMEDLNSEKDKLRVKNCLILIINLFFDLKSPDILCNKGKSSKDLSNTERNLMNDHLKLEINN